MEFTKLLVPLSALLGLSLVVERVLEFLKGMLEPLLGAERRMASESLPAIKERFRQVERAYELDRMVRTSEESAEGRGEGGVAIAAPSMAETDPSLRRDLEAAREWDEACPRSTVLVVGATDPSDGAVLRTFVLQIVGLAAGIILARTAGLPFFSRAVFGACDEPWWDFALTGLLIGGGSAPIHALIRFVTERKELAAELFPVSSEETESDLPPCDPASAAGSLASATTISEPKGPAIIARSATPETEGWVDIPYAGGVDRELLEDIQRRRVDPDMIVYHHTAMKDTSSFEDVVAVIKGRTDPDGIHWLTGYNCVVQSDGSVHAFCRWDRYGSHAYGYNLRSLGLAFNGNYETDPSAPFSNYRGAYGATRPTEAQLKAAARVVVLWTFLYPAIAVDFEKSIIPHNRISKKSCPGNMFPYEEFKGWIMNYRSRWEKSDVVRKKIADFNLKPYVHC